MLGTLLSGIDTALGGGPRSWSDVVVVRNVGPLQTEAPLPGDVISNRGFNAVLCAAGGRPEHFLKLRPIGHRLFEREAAVTELLGNRPATGSLVPPAQTFTTGPARVLAQRFVAGRSLDLLIRKSQRRHWQPTAAQVLHVCAPLWEGIADAATALGFAPSVQRVDTAALLEDLDQLASQGVAAAAIGSLRARLAPAQLAPVPQHGDFWPRNLLVVGDGWRVLDFECCGDVMLPLYDVLHFLRGCAESASGGQIGSSEPWLDAIAQSDVLREQFRCATRGMTKDAVEAALIAYLVDFAARLHRRGIAQERIEGRRRELEKLPAALDGGAIRALLG